MTPEELADEAQKKRDVRLRKNRYTVHFANNFKAKATIIFLFTLGKLQRNVGERKKNM